MLLPVYSTVHVSIIAPMNYINYCIFLPIAKATNDDVTPPTITSCPRNVLVGATDATGGTARWTEPLATDNSGIDPRRSTTHTPGNRFPLGTSRVTYTFTDVAGNSAVCSFNVEVVSNIGMAFFLSLNVYNIPSLCGFIRSYMV